MDLDGPICAFFIGDVSGRRWTVDIVVRLDVRLVDHVVAVVELEPIMLGHLHLLLVHLCHLLLLLRVAIIVAIFTLVHLLLSHSLLVLFLFLNVGKATISVTLIAFLKSKLTFIC